MNINALTSQAQTILNKILEGNNTKMYVINPDGSFMEIQPECTLLNVNNETETYINTEERKQQWQIKLSTWLR